MQNSKNVFEGAGAFRNLLDSGNLPFIPLIVAILATFFFDWRLDKKEATTSLVK